MTTMMILFLKIMTILRMTLMRILITILMVTGAAACLVPRP